MDATPQDAGKAVDRFVEALKNAGVIKESQPTTAQLIEAGWERAKSESKIANSSTGGYGNDWIDDDITTGITAWKTYRQRFEALEAENAKLREFVEAVTSDNIFKTHIEVRLQATALLAELSEVK